MIKQLYTHYTVISTSRIPNLFYFNNFVAKNQQDYINQLKLVPNRVDTAYEYIAEVDMVTNEYKYLLLPGQRENQIKKNPKELINTLYSIDMFEVGKIYKIKGNYGSTFSFGNEFGINSLVYECYFIVTDINYTLNQIEIVKTNTLNRCRKFVKENYVSI